MDKAYLDYGRLHRLQRSGAFFVTRAKQNARFSRRYSHPADKPAGIRFDQTVTLSGFVSHRHYPDTLRRIGYRNPVTGKDFVFITNNFIQPALTIARLYKSRWQVELFFKWIKQHLRIKAFYGTSENAVRVQIWVAIAVYVLISIVRKRASLPHSPYTILQILSVTLFEKAPLFQVFSENQPISETLGMQEEPYLPGFLTGQ
jgi:hypothetical protein